MKRRREEAPHDRWIELIKLVGDSTDEITRILGYTPAARRMAERIVCSVCDWSEYTDEKLYGNSRRSVKAFARTLGGVSTPRFWNQKIADIAPRMIAKQRRIKRGKKT